AGWSRGLTRPGLVRVALLAALKATAFGFMPAVVLLSIGGYRPVAVILLGVPALFVIGATACRVGRELWGPAEAPALRPPDPPLGPKGVLSQAEAAAQFNDLFTELWEQDRCGP